MKRIYRIVAVAAAGAGLLSCALDAPVSQDVLNTISVTVKDFPSYSADSKAVGIPDPGKTSWTAGDEILVRIGSQNLVLTFSGNSWGFDEAVAETGAADVTAYYAPDYVWGETSPVLLSGAVAGLDEFIKYEYRDENVSDGIVIDFTGMRNYSRLRVAASSGAEVSMAGDFVPVGTDASVGETGLKAVADANGNAFFFGTWPSAAELDFDVAGTPYHRTMSDASTAGKGYVLDATPGYSYDEMTNTLTITKAEGLVYFASIVNDGTNSDVNVLLDNDIDLSSVCGESLGNWIPVGTNVVDNAKYSGTFDGQGHTVSGLYYSSDAADQYVGLFGIAGGCVIKNLNVAGTINVPAGRYNGGIAGWIEDDAIVTGCSFDGEVTGATYVGCIAGRNDGATVENTVNEGNVSISGNYAGGIVGYCTAGAKVVACINYGGVNSNRYSGGIVGYNRDGSIIVACCNLSDNLVSGGYIGGITAYNYGSSTVVSSYNTGNFDTTEGAIVCNNASSAVTACYWEGDVAEAVTRGDIDAVEASKVDGATVNWTSGEGIGNAMEYMNANIPSGYPWQFIPGSGDDMPLAIVRK